MKPPALGEIWMIELNPVRGHEQAGRRPCLVVSDDLYNSGPAEKHIVVPVTSKNKHIPYHIVIVPPEGGLRMESYLMCDDIRSVSRERFQHKTGAVSNRTMHAIKDCLRTLLSM